MAVPGDIAAWRKERRRELLALRAALPGEARREGDERVAGFLLEGFPLLATMTVGFYWPFKGEVDPRVAVHRLRQRGARTALPVVVGKAGPLEFREWGPDTPTVPGPFGLPMPRGSETVAPDALLAPPVGYDAACYRLGYGGGYFDRTLAAAAPRPLAIGLARAASFIETIHPQPWDIPLDFILTEDGIHVAGAGGLRRLDTPGEAAGIARALIDARLRR